jgi:thioesterase domain-containing protein
VLLIEAEQQPDGFEVGVRLGWRELAPNLTICTVPGGHLSIVQEPFAEAVAGELRAYLDGAARITTAVSPLSW